MIKSLIFIILFIASMTMHASRAEEAGQTDAYSLGTFPFVSPKILEDTFLPLVREMETMLGKPVQFRLKTTYQKFIEELDKQRYDIAFVQPFDYIWAHDKYGYKPMVRRNYPLEAIFVVAADSPIKSLADLKGKAIALPPEVAAVSRLGKIKLLQVGIDINKDVSFKYSKNHFSCMYKLISKTVDACGTALPALRLFKKKKGVPDKELRIIAQSDSIPNSIFIVHPRVPEDDYNKIQELLLSLESARHGKKFLKSQAILSLTNATDSEYDIVRTYQSRLQSMEQ